MTLLQKVEKINRQVSGLIEWVGILAYLLIMLITCVDVVGSKLFSMPVFGSIDMVMLAQLIAIAFASGMTLLMGRHVQVEFFSRLLPGFLQEICNCIVYFLGFTLFILICWRLFVYGYSFQTGGEETATAYIPLFPFVYLTALALIPTCLIFLHKFIDSIIKVIKK